MCYLVELKKVSSNSMLGATLGSGADLLMNRPEAGHRGHGSPDGVACCCHCADALHEAQLLCEA